MKYRSITLLLWLLPATLLNAQIDRSKAPEPGPAPVIRVGEYQTFSLKNGLKVFLVENHKIPRVAWSLVLEIDPFTEGDSMGYTSIAGQLLGTATTTRTKDQLDEEIDFIGATLQTTASSVFGAALKKHNEKLLDLMADILLNPVFNQDELDKIKKQTISGLAYNKTDPSSISGVVQDVLLFGKDHPYGEVTTEASVESVTLEMCEDYYHTYFRPNIAYLAIVGDLNLKEAKKLARQYFGKWESSSVPHHSYPLPEPPKAVQVSIVDRPNAVQSVVKVTHPDVFTVGMDDYIAGRVMNLMLGGTFARLDQNLREDHGYTYGVNSTLNQDKWIGSFTVSTDVRNEVTDSAIYQILYEMKRIRSGVPPAEEVEKIKNYMSGTFALALEKPATVAQFAVNIARYNLPPDYYANYLRYISEVTPEEVLEAARKYIHPDSCYILVVGKADKIADNLEAFSSAGTIQYYDVEGNQLDEADVNKVLPEGLTARKVIEDYLAAIGGRKKLESLKDLSIKMTMDMQGMSLESETLRKAPDKFRMSMSMGGNVVSLTSFDGTNGKTSGYQGEKVLQGDDLEKLRVQSLFMPELDYPAAGFTVKLLSMEMIDGREAYKLEVTDPAGGSSLEYYDAGTGYKIMEESTRETPGGTIVQSSKYEDYRVVDGIMFPYRIVIHMGPQTITATVESIAVNSGLDDSLFR
jgi:zinc protease